MHELADKSSISSFRGLAVPVGTKLLFCFMDGQRSISVSPVKLYLSCLHLVRALLLIGSVCVP